MLPVPRSVALQHDGFRQGIRRQVHPGKESIPLSDGDALVGRIHGVVLDLAITRLTAIQLTTVGRDLIFTHEIPAPTDRSTGIENIVDPDRRMSLARSDPLVQVLLPLRLSRFEFLDGALDELFNFDKVTGELLFIGPSLVSHHPHLGAATRWCGIEASIRITNMLFIIDVGEERSE